MIAMLHLNMIEIRFFKEGDLEEAVDIFSELSSYYLKDHASPKSSIRTNLEKNILGPDSGVKLILGFIDNKAVALSTISLLYPAPRETSQLYIKELFTSPRYQGKGIGREIMKFIARFALLKNCSRLDWSTESSNKIATNFYAKIGAKKLEEKVYYRVEGELLHRLAESR